ncbi:MAG: hypothetical protein O3A00_09900 [Planctomycetota bacterium]|nr:hypothetical protein [Planctomycetota bacterium]
MRQFNHRFVCAAIVAVLSPTQANAWQHVESYMKTRSRVIGVQPSPLSAYPELMRRHFPRGMPVRESGVVLDLLRAKQSQQLLGRPTYFGFGAGFRVSPNSQLPHRALPVALQRNQIGSIDDLVVRVIPANIGNGVDVNALALSIHGVDAHEHVVPLRGTVQATLYGLEDRHDRDHSIRDPQAMALPANARVRRMAIWVRSISTHGNGWETKLELPRSRPDVNPYWSTHGLLRVRVIVPGVGIFEKNRPVEIGTTLDPNIK